MGDRFFDAAAVDYAVSHPSHVRVRGDAYTHSADPAASTQFGMADWYWLAARPAATTLSSVVEAPCAWQRCIARLGGPPLQNERLMVLWALSNKLTVSAMESPQAKRINGLNPRQTAACGREAFNASHEA